MDWVDRRPLDQLQFGIAFPENERKHVADFVRHTLVVCGAQTAEDISRIGCTTLFAHGLDIEACRKIRLGVGGGGVGIPCFVGMDRYCLVHDTIGGLQENQTPHDPEQIPHITRELTAEEKAKVALVETARRVQGKTGADRLIKTMDLLRGREGVTSDLENELDRVIGDAVVEPEAEAVESVKEPHNVTVLADRMRRAKSAGLDGDLMAELLETGANELEYLKGLIGRLAALPAPGAPSWECPDHPAVNWACRYCIAQEIVKGPFTPRLFLVPAFEGTRAMTDNIAAVVGEEVDATVEKMQQHEPDVVGLFVQAARWRRKLSRE